MNRRCFALVAVPFVVFASSCDNDETGTGGQSVGGQGGTGGSEVEPSNWIPGEPGVPGTPIRLGAGMPFAQGLAVRQKSTSGFQAMTHEHCFNMGGADAGGADAGGGGQGGETPVTYCPSSYTPTNPSLDLSEITQTDLQIVVASQPLLQPAEDPETQEACSMASEPISFGGLYRGDCTGTLQPMDVFTADDVAGFFGLAQNLLPANTHLPASFAGGSGPVRTITGSSVRTAAIGDTTYVVSNVSSTLIQVDADPVNPGAFLRQDHDLGSRGISGLMALPDGRLVFSTLRTFTVDSWNNGSPDPSTLVEASPVLIKTYDPATDTVSDLATISGGTKVRSQNGTPATVDQGGNPTSYFIAGSTNVLASSQDGNILFSDRLTGKVWKISLDGSSVVELFSVPAGVLLSGLTEAPNDIIYVVKAPTADENCTSIISSPIIAYWDDQSQALVDWYELNDPQYTDILPIVCTTGVIERSSMMGLAFLGSGLFVDIVHDPQGNLIVTASVTGVTQAVPVVVGP